MAALAGEGGSGKSHCAKAFAKQWFDEKTDRWGWWLNAETETELRKSCIELLENLGETVQGNTSTSDLASRTLEKLCDNRFEWILVFDNAPEISSDGSTEGPEVIQPLFFPTPLGDWGGEPRTHPIHDSVGVVRQSGS